MPDGIQVRVEPASRATHASFAEAQPAAGRLPLREGKKAWSFAKSSGKIWCKHKNSAMNTTGVDIRRGQGDGCRRFRLRQEWVRARAEGRRKTEIIFPAEL
ncbi:MAG: hypothetical protein LBE06_06895 [Azoarcus sp.]|jgi:hypothetical protein|nr:hypothetical protein [Azoarcus sp.]